MRTKLISLAVLVLLAIMLVMPAAPASAMGVCASTGEDWDKIEVCGEWDGGICVETWASSGPRVFPIWNTCP